MEEFVDELWQILNSDESEVNRIALAKELVTDWAEESNHDLPEILEFNMEDDSNG